MSSSTSSLGDIASITEYDTCRYRHCEDSDPVDETDSEPYCMPACRRRADAAGIMNDIKHDPRFCANSFHQIGEYVEQGREIGSSKVRTAVWYVNLPNRRYPVRTKSPADPYAYFREDGNREHLDPMLVPTKHTERGPGDRLSLSDPHPDTNYQTAKEPTNTLNCVCGVGHHTTTVRPIQGVEEMVAGYALRLSDVLDVLCEEGEAPPHDPDVLLDEVRAQKTDPQNHTPDQHRFINAMAEALQFDSDPDSDHEHEHEQ
ncbi:hypothetical protein [Halalkalicoccus jeotgali]|nr:hypothetical protein [Halalkalicoccus jeotgali]